MQFVEKDSSVLRKVLIRFLRDVDKPPIMQFRNERRTASMNSFPDGIGKTVSRKKVAVKSVLQFVNAAFLLRGQADLLGEIHNFDRVIGFF